MAVLQFGNVSADMRDANYGIAAIDAFEDFATTFVPAGSEVLEESDARAVVRVYNDAGDDLVVTIKGNFAAQQVSYVAIEGGGATFKLWGDFVVDVESLSVSGSFDRWRVGSTDGSLFWDLSEVNASFSLSLADGSGELPDLSDAAVFAGADVITGGTGDDYLLGYGGSDAITGNAGADTLSGAGGNDTLAGKSGGDLLAGGQGADTLAGGGGNDTYSIDASDTLMEASGIDTVRAGFSHELPSGFENLVLLGGSAIDGTGNAAANVLTGNSADNRLNGLSGADSLVGGGGADRLVGGADADTLAGGAGRDTLAGGTGADRIDFDTASISVDHIVGFNETEDFIQLDAAIFSAIAPGALDPAAFRNGVTAQDADDRILYSPTNGKLFYDGDGAGEAAATLFAILDGAPAIGAGNFFIVA